MSQSSDKSMQVKTKLAKNDKPRAKPETGLQAQLKTLQTPKSSKTKSSKVEEDLHSPQLTDSSYNYITLPVNLKTKKIYGQQGVYQTQNGEAERYIYVSRVSTDNIDDEEEKEAALRSVRVVGVPITFCDSDVAECLGAMATVEAAFPSKTPIQTPGMREYTVVLESEDDVETVMSTSNARVFVEPSGDMGMRTWAKSFFDQRPDFERLQNQVDVFLNAFDQRTELERKRDMSRPLVDEEGFTLVTYGKRAKTESQLKAQRREAAKEYNKKMLKQEEMLQSFYKFQDMEKKQNKLALLKKKFEEDKLKIQEMKASRKFKPF